MNKLKFKSVKFKPTDRYLSPDFNMGWQDATYQFKVTFTEDYINLHPELFEVEKAEREFEDGAYYKVRFQGCLNYEVALCRINLTNGLFTFTIPDHKPQYKEAFQEVGEKIKLKIEL